MARILIVDDNMDLGALLSSALTERGHQTGLYFLGRDALTALQTGRFDAALVDLHLPDVKGTEVLAAMRDAGILAFAISGVFRGEAFAREVTQTFGARALVEKPFDLRGLIDTVEAALPGGAPAPAAEAPELLLSESIESDADGRKASPSADLPFSTRAVWEGSARPATASTRALPSLGPLASPLSGTSVPRLLAAAHQGRATGELRLRRGPVLKVLWLERGRPIYAASNVAAERFGRFSVASGDLTAADLETVAELATREKLRTGEAMVRLGLVTPERRVALLHAQASQIIASTFDWTEGEHQFISRSVGKPEVVPLQLGLPALVHAGLQRLPLLRLRERVPEALTPSPTADPVFELQELELTAPQARLLMSADGTKRVADLLQLTDLEEREALSLLLTLLELRVLEPRAASASRRIVLV